MASEWWRGGIVYEIYPRSFKDSNGDGVGDLKGITERLGHVADLGVDAVWIAPFFKSPMKDFGYDVSDYRQVDPIFGTLGDFDALIAEAHRRGLKVITDYVISHTSDEHPWFQESRASKDNPKADWYVWADMKRDGGPPTNWLSVFGGPSWQWDTRRRQYYLHNFLTTQPDLNFHSHALQDAVLGEMRFWLQRGINGFRLDALNMMVHDRELRDNPQADDPSKSEQPLSNPYTYQMHLFDKSRPEVVPMLRRIRALLDEFGATTSLAEVGDETATTLRLMREYSSGGDKVHMCYGFDFLSPAFSVPHVRGIIERFEAAAGDSWPCWAFSNHDCIRHATRWARPGETPERLARFAIALLLSLRGSICLYQGEELGLTEADIAFEDLKDPAGITFWPEYKGRDGCRTPMPWDQTQPNAGFGAGTPWLPVSRAHVPLAAARQAADAASTLNFYRKAIGVRKGSMALRLGGIDCEETSGDVLVLHRDLDGEKVVCVFNFGSNAAANPHLGHGKLLLTSGPEDAGTIEPYGFRWVRVG